MSIGKYLSLEEARKKGLLGRFAKEHSSKGDQTSDLKSYDRRARAVRRIKI